MAAQSPLLNPATPNSAPPNHHCFTRSSNPSSTFGYSTLSALSLYSPGQPKIETLDSIAIIYFLTTTTLLLLITLNWPISSLLHALATSYHYTTAKIQRDWARLTTPKPAKDPKAPRINQAFSDRETHRLKKEYGNAVLVAARLRISNPGAKLTSLLTTQTSAHQSRPLFTRLFNHRRKSRAESPGARGHGEGNEGARTSLVGCCLDCL